MQYFRWSYSTATAKHNSRNYMIIPICVFKIIYDINVCMCEEFVSNEKLMKTSVSKILWILLAGNNYSHFRSYYMKFQVQQFDTGVHEMKDTTGKLRCGFC